MPSVLTRSRPRRERLLDLVGTRRVELLADLRDELEEPRLFARRAGARLRQVDGTTPAIRPGRGDMTTTRVDRNTASEIE